jgi:hypothetical protein
MPRTPLEAAVSAPPGQIVSLSAVTWDFPLVGRTRMLTEAWLTAGQPTTFVQVPSLRTALEKVTAHRRRAAAHVVRPWPNVPPRFWLGTSGAIPEHTIALQARDLRRRLDSRLNWSRATAVVVSPLWTPWLRYLPFARVIYDYIDELAVHVPTRRLAPLYARWEDELITQANAVVVSASRLGDAIQEQYPDKPTTLIPNGVDVTLFQARAAAPRPDDVPADRPVVGFVGALYEWIDWELIGAMAERFPAVDFVFVGPAKPGNPHVAALGEQENIHFLGPRPYDRVPAYMQAFDVCWIPFDQSPIAQAANPVKLYEYLALGKPVVTTPVADLHLLDDLVSVGDSVDSVAGALTAALEGAGPTPAERVAFAQQNDWAARAAAYQQFITTLYDAAAEGELA